MYNIKHYIKNRILILLVTVLLQLCLYSISVFAVSDYGKDISEILHLLTIKHSRYDTRCATVQSDRLLPPYTHTKLPMSFIFTCRWLQNIVSNVTKDIPDCTESRQTNNLPLYRATTIVHVTFWLKLLPFLFILKQSDADCDHLDESKDEMSSFEQNIETISRA
jgi:hypothetical protein